MYGFIYETTNNTNNKKYIGQRKYYKGWETYLGSGSALKIAIERDGKENFSRVILEEAETKEELNELEILYIKKFDAVKSKDFYNFAEGGDVVVMPKEKQAEVSRKLSKNYSGENAIWYGRKHSEESKKIMSDKRKELYPDGNIHLIGKKKSDETKRKMSKSMTGLKKSEIAKENIGQSVRDRAPNMYAVKGNIAYEFNCMSDLAKWFILSGSAHSDKENNVKKVLRTRELNGVAYSGYTIYKNTVKESVETIEKIT